MDLFTPVVNTSEFHPNFASTLDLAANGPRQVLASWASTFPDRDGKFVKEFQTTFNSGFWELYLHAAFRELGFTVDYQHHAPDFPIVSPVEFNAEAAIANEAHGFAPEWTMQLDELEKLIQKEEELLRFASVRLSNAIHSKASKFRSSYSKLPHVQGKPFVICVASFEQPGFFLSRDRALWRVLYRYDGPVQTDGPNDPIILAESWIPEVLKDNGASIDMGLFASPAMSEVSAVIFNHTATFSKLRALDPSRDENSRFCAVRFNKQGTKPLVIEASGLAHSESVLDGLSVFVNPFAAVPLDLNVFAGHEVAIHTLDPVMNRVLSNTPDRFLFSRSSIGNVPMGATSRVRSRREVKRSYAKPVRHSWPEGLLRPVRSTDFLFDDHHLAHYAGWTIHVAKDTDDGVWVGRAVQHICFSTGEVARAANNGAEDVIAPGCHSTAELAMYATIASIKEHLAGESAEE